MKIVFFQKASLGCHILWQCLFSVWCSDLLLPRNFIFCQCSSNNMGRLSWGLNHVNSKGMSSYRMSRYAGSTLLESLSVVSKYDLKLIFYCRQRKTILWQASTNIKIWIELHVVNKNRLEDFIFISFENIVYLIFRSNSHIHPFQDI